MASEWQSIFDADRDLAEVLSAAPLDERGFSQWISEELASRGLQKNAVVRDSRLNQTFAYQIMAGTRHASRDKLVQLAFGLHMDADETCGLLERGGVSRLLPSCKRDVIIAYYLQHGLDVAGCDDALWSQGEQTLMAPATKSRA